VEFLSLQQREEFEQLLFLTLAEFSNDIGELL
jgi:hypothetical protein